MKFKDYINKVYSIDINVSNYSSFSSSFISAVKTINDPGAKPEWIMVAYAKMLTSFAATMSDAGIVKFADKFADFTTLVTNIDKIIDEMTKNEGVYGSDTLATVVSSACSLLASISGKLKFPFAVTISLEVISHAASWYSLVADNVNQNLEDLEELVEELSIERKTLLEDFISNKIPEERNASLLNYVNKIKPEAALIDITYEELEALIAEQVSEQGLADDFFAEQGLIIQDVIGKAQAKETAIDNLEEVYSNEEFEWFLLDFTGKYDIDADVYIEDEGELDLRFAEAEEKYISIIKEYVKETLVENHQNDVESLFDIEVSESTNFINNELALIGATDTLGFAKKIARELNPHKTLAIDLATQAAAASTDNASLKVLLETQKAEYEGNVEATAQITKDQASLFVRNELEANAKNTINLFIQNLLTVVLSEIAEEQSEVSTHQALLDIGSWAQETLTLISQAQQTNSIDVLSDSAIDNADRKLKLSTYTDNAQTSLQSTIDQKLSDLEAISQNQIIGSGPGPQYTTFTDDDDDVYGTDDDDALSALGGNDTVYSYGGDDDLKLGSGDDIAYSGSGNDDINGGTGNDTIYAGSGNDDVKGWTGNDYIDAGTGNDFIEGDAGDDVVHAGAGDDLVYLGDDNDTAFAGDGNDIVHGESGNDVIEAGDGNDTVNGGIGNDDISAGAGNDLVEGGEGVDILAGDDGNDHLFAGEQTDLTFVSQSAGSATGLISDWLAGGAGDDVLVGDAGINALTGGAGSDTIYAGAGRDFIYADAEKVGNNANWLVQDTEDIIEFNTSGNWNSNDYGDDYINAGDGDDVVRGQGGNDTLKGGSGDDSILGDVLNVAGIGNVVAGAQHGSDIIDGGEGNDELSGDGGSDYIWGGAGDDAIRGDSVDVAVEFHGSDIIFGEAGDDEIAGQGGEDYLEGGSGADHIYGDFGDAAVEGSNDVLLGGEGNDFLYGEGGDDSLSGGSGNDELYGGSGEDELSGGEGDDYIAGDNELIDSEDHGNDTLYGNAGSDILVGGGGDDDLNGGVGDDFLLSGDGNDHLLGGEGADYLKGGAGADTYRFEVGDSPMDGLLENILDAPGEGNHIVFGPSVSEANITLSIFGDDLFIIYHPGDGFNITGGMNGAVSSFTFESSGNSYSFEQFFGANYSEPQFELGTAEDDLLIGGSATNNLFGGQGNDTLVGGLGENNLFGESGNDTLIHQGGSSTLNGGEGDDHYIIHLTDSTDVTVIDSSGANTLELISEQTDQSIYFNSVGDDLVIKVGAEQVLVPNWLSTNFVSYQLPDGSVLSHDDVLAQLNTAPVAVYSDAVETAEDSLFIYELTGGMFADAEMDDLSFSVTLASGEALPAWLAYDEANKRLIGTPGNDDVGGLSLAITATDPGGFSVSSSLDITVQNTNDAPVAVADIVVPITSSAELKYSVTIAGAGGDTWIEKHGDGTLVFWNSDGWKYQKLAADGSIASEVKTLDLQGAELVRVFSQGGEVKIFTNRLVELESPYVEGLYSEVTQLFEQSVSEGLDIGQPVFVSKISHMADTAEVIWSMDDQKGVLWEHAANVDNYVYAVVNNDTLEKQSVNAGWDSYGFYDDSVSRISDNEVALVLGNSTSLKIEIFNQTVEPNNSSLNSNTFYLSYPELGLGYKESYVFRVSEDELIALIDFGGNPNYDGNWTYSELHYSIVNTTDKTYSSLKKVSEFSEQQNVIDVDYVSSSGVENAVFVTFAEENDLGLFEIKGRFISALGEQVGDDLLLSTAPVNDYQIFRDDYFDMRKGSGYGYGDDSYPDAGQYGYNTIVRDGEVLSVWSTPEGVHVSSVTLNSGASDSFIYDPLSNDFDVDTVNVNETLTVVSAVITQGMGSVSIVDGKVAYDSVGAYEYLPLENEYDIVIEYIIRDSSGAESTSTITTQINGQTDQNSFAENVVFKPLEDPYYGPITTGDGDDYVYINTSGSSSSSSGGNSTFSINTGKGKDVVVFEEAPYAGEPISTSYNITGLGGNAIYLILNQISKSFSFNNPFGNNTLSIGGSKSSGVQDLNYSSPFSFPKLGFGSLKLSFEGVDTEIHLENFDPNDVLGGPRDIDTFIFNGVTYSYEELVAFGFDLEGDAGDNVITGTSVVDRFYGGEGNDQLEGGEGDDTYYYDLGDGDDLIIDQVGSNKIVFGEGVSTADLNFSMIENDLVIAIGDSGQITVQNWETNEGFAITEFETAEGILSASDVLELLPVPQDTDIIATEDSDFTYTLPSDLFSDVGAQNDLSLTATLADGTSLPEWLSFDPVTGTFTGMPENDDVGNLLIQVNAYFGVAGTTGSSSHNFTLVVNNSNDAPEVNGVLEDVYIDAGSDFNYTLPEDLFVDVDTDDQLTISVSTNDGTPIPDWLTFNPETLTLQGTPTLNEIGELVLSVTATDLAGEQVVTPLQLTVDDYDNKDELLADYPAISTRQGTPGDDLVDGSNSDNLLIGGSGNDELVGKAGNDHLIGGRGNDFLNGGYGSDSYYFSPGFGHDMIKNYDSRSSSVDRIVFDAAITTDDVEVEREGSHLILRVGDDEIKVLYHFIDQMTGHQLLDEVHFSDGTVWTAHDIGQMVLVASEEADDLHGYMADEVLDGLAGDDSIRGNDGNDDLTGGLGDDSLYGGQGDDALIGGSGNDYLKGDSGNDRYLFESGHGLDEIHNESDSIEDIDTVVFADTASDDLWFSSRWGRDLVINKSGTTDQVIIDDWYVDEKYQVDVIEASDATLEASQIDALVQAMASFDAPDGAGEVISQEVKDQLQPVLASNWTANP